MNWVEVDGASLRWVHGLVIPINKYTVYIPILYVTKMTQNKNDSINSCY